MNRIHELLDRWAETARDRPAILEDDGSAHTYGAFGEASVDAAKCLAEAGVGGGDRVAVIGENSLALASFLLAASRLDAWVIPINARMSLNEIAKVADHASASALVFTHRVSEAAAAHAAAMGAVERTGAFGSVMIAGNRDGSPEEVFQSPLEQVAAMIYTTGTTGDPKGVMLTHENLLYSSRVSMEIRGMSNEDTILSVIPMTHIFGFSSAFLAAVRAGAHIRFMPRFDPEKVFAALQDGVSVMPAVPQIYALLMSYAEKQGWETAPAPRLRYISSGGAPLDYEWKRKVEAFFGMTLHNGYGMTEAGPGMCATRVGQERTDIACGPPLDGQEVRLVPPPGQSECEDGVGEITVSGPNIMKGYYKNPGETAKALDEEGYLHTGDLGRFTEDGALMVVGRCKELIIRSGFNVYPPEVEAAITKHPDVAISAVIGRRENDGNEEVLAFVQPAEGRSVTADVLKDHLKPLLAPYKRPGRYVIADVLPAASTGKILKHKLLETFADEVKDPSN
ncbi:MAG: class I adenylate-forming enzyme family protein [Pseudomonadota bacterium]